LFQLTVIIIWTERNGARQGGAVDLVDEGGREASPKAGKRASGRSKKGM